MEIMGAFVAHWANNRKLHEACWACVSTRGPPKYDIRHEDVQSMFMRLHREDPRVPRWMQKEIETREFFPFEETRPGNAPVKPRAQEEAHHPLTDPVPSGNSARATPSLRFLTPPPRKTFLSPSMHRNRSPLVVWLYATLWSGFSPPLTSVTSTYRISGRRRGDHRRRLARLLYVLGPRRRCRGWSNLKAMDHRRCLQSLRGGCDRHRRVSCERLEPARNHANAASARSNPHRVPGTTLEAARGVEWVVRMTFPVQIRKFQLRFRIVVQGDN